MNEPSPAQRRIANAAHKTEGNESERSITKTSNEYNKKGEIERVEIKC